MGCGAGRKLFRAMAFANILRVRSAPWRHSLRLTSWSFRISRLPLLLGLVLLGAARGSAQVRVSGRVVEEQGGGPLASAHVVFRTPEGRYITRVWTDSAGAFEVLINNAEGVKIRAERAGYLPNTTPTLYFDGRSFYRVEVRLDTDAVLLAPLEVLARSDVDPSHFLDAFRHRLALGNGRYITHADIERQKPMYVSDLLRTLPGIEVTTDGSGHRGVVQVARSRGKFCSTQIFIDGMLANPPAANASGSGFDVFRIDDVISPYSVEGIEVYMGLSTIPPEFLTADAQCGVIAIWSRRGGA